MLLQLCSHPGGVNGLQEELILWLSLATAAPSSLCLIAPAALQKPLL